MMHLGIYRLVFVGTLLLSIMSEPAVAVDRTATKKRVDAHLNAWDLASAGAELAALTDTAGNDLDVLWLQARLAHLRGQYVDAVDYLTRAVAIMPDDKGLNAMLGRYRRTRDLVATF